MRGKITEIFASIQGEGIYCGERQIFVRFSQCNLRCAYCDTDYHRFQEYEAGELFGRIESFGRQFHSVSFTGGEPLLQKDFLRESLRLLKKTGYKTYLETNGTLPEALQEVIEDVDIIAMDIKLPSSGGSVTYYWNEHRDFLKVADKKDVFIKVVITSLTTEEDFAAMLEMLRNEQYCGVLVLQPNSFEGRDALEEKIAFLKGLTEAYPFPVCVIPQLHKIIGVK